MLSTATITMRCQTCGAVIDVPLEIDSNVAEGDLNVRISMHPADDLLLGVWSMAHRGPFGEA